MSDTNIQSVKPTRETYDPLQQAYENLNRSLFEGELPNCLITLQRSKKSYGYFCGDRFGRADGTLTDEIALNPTHFRDRPQEEVLATLAHEMVHLWQHHFGKPGRGRYHNKEWAEKMRSIGLQPTSTGKDDGAETGDVMGHIIVADVRGKNRQIEEQYAERLREQRTLRFGTLEAEVQRLTTSAGEMNRVLDAARQLRATASQRAEAYGIETDRELKGAPGYKAGAGSQYREALARKTAADADLAKAASDISIYEPRMADAQKKLDKASADVRAAEAAFAGEAAQIDEERKSHLIPDRNDALMSYLALEEVYADPRFGTAARHFSWLMMAVLMTFELSYVVVRAWFTHASVYMAILIGDTKKRADRVAADYESSRDALRRSPDATALMGRAPLRFLPAQSPAVAVGEVREMGARNLPLRKST